MKARLGELLVKKGFVALSDVEEALKEQKLNRKLIGQILVQNKKVSEENLLKVLGEQLHIEFVDLRKKPINPKAVQAIPAKLATYYNIMPVDLKDKVITIAVHEPSNHWPLDDIQVNYGLQPVMVLACHDQILKAIQKHYGVGADTVEKIMVREEESIKAVQKETEEVKVLTEMAASADQDATVVHLVDQILSEAARKGASDIHFERGRDTLTVRYRVDGILAEAPLPSEIHYLAPAIVSRIKIMSGMDIVEKRLPQDGRSRMKIDGVEYDLRASILPSRHGEDVAVRLLPSQTHFSFERLGMNAKKLETFQELIRHPHGILFVTGPTGSGKSTTLYTCLSNISSREKKVVTVEDPIEYEISGITQIQVNTVIGLTFARTLRNVLRHDPDVVMVGEVRDAETAKIAVQASLTGHLVFSTLHTNDAASGVTRLLDMGIEPFLIASSIRAFVAQRLIRRVCSECKCDVPSAEVNRWKKYLDSDHPISLDKMQRGKGCEQCNYSGYKGREAIYEILPLESGIQDLVLARASAAKVKQMAVSQFQLQTLWRDGWEKVAQGRTTPEEVLRVVGEMRS